MAIPIEPDNPDDGGYTPPPTSSGDWAKIDDFAGDVTAYKSCSFTYLDTSGIIDLAGDYVILSLSEDEIILSNPNVVNPDWDDLSEATAYASPSISTNGIAWVGPFDVDISSDPGTKIVFNVIAASGMYGINKDGEQIARAETAVAEFWPVDKDGNAIGPTESISQVLTGSNTDKKQVAMSMVASPTFSGRARARMRRTTPTDLNPKHQAVDEMKWESCFGLSPVLQDHFGDVTTVFTRTYATQSATAVKERKLNCLVTRKIPEWNGTAFVGSEPQTDAAPIICAMALDERIGGRSLSEINVAQIYAEVQALKNYFGIEEATKFCYTFDDDNISFEETVSTVAQAIFSTAYRLGNVLHLYGEMATDTSLLLFNHRNKMPKSEVRTVTFGNINDYDGIELTYVNPDDDSTATIYLPEDQTARNPRKIDTVGIRNEMQAMLTAHRAYNKIVYQNTTSQFEALEEAEYLINNNRILVADNTRANTHDGYIKSQVGLVLELSQPFEPSPGVEYTVFLQHTDGTVEAIACEAGADKWHIVIESAPALPLSLGAEKVVVASYWIVGDNEPRASAFLLTEKESNSKNTYNLTAVNYDSRYYFNDKDFYRFTVDADATIDSTYITADGNMD